MPFTQRPAGLSSRQWRAARGARNLLGAAVALVFFERTACGYIDPGAGTLAWQMVLAALVGSLFYLRRVMAWFKGKDRRR